MKIATSSSKSPWAPWTTQLYSFRHQNTQLPAKTVLQDPRHNLRPIPEQDHLNSLILFLLKIRNHNISSRMDLFNVCNVARSSKQSPFLSENIQLLYITLLTYKGDIPRHTTHSFHAKTVVSSLQSAAIFNDIGKVTMKPQRVNGISVQLKDANFRRAGCAADSGDAITPSDTLGENTAYMWHMYY